MNLERLDNERFYTLYDRVGEKIYQLRNKREWSWYASRLRLIFARMGFDNARRMRKESPWQN